MSRPLAVPKEYISKVNNDLSFILDYLTMQRKKSGLTQADLAEKMGCGVTSVQAIENKRKTPSTKTLLLMMRVLNVKFDLK